MSHLTQKERMLLQDQLGHEQVCITKYTSYASRARDPQVRNMFNEFASEEQQHYDTINNLLQGKQTQTGMGATQGAQSTQGTQGTQGGAKAGKSHQAGSQGAGWQATGQATQAGSLSYSMTGNAGQTDRRVGSQTGSYQATSGVTNQQGSMGSDATNQQGWLSDSRTIYGGQVSGAQGGAGTQLTQGTQGTGQGQSSASKSRRGTTDFEAGSDIGVGGAGTSDDKSMLEDMLMTEKYVSGSYDTAVFESANPQVRQALQHIQKDEQKHGEGIFQHMQQSGMYQPQ